jgi:hypothetical protein
MNDSRMAEHNLSGETMKDAELIRVGSKLFNPDGTMHTDCKTINRAKKASRDYQKSKGTMGEGRVRVALKPPQKVAEAA